MICGMPELKEMMDFCPKENIVSDVEIVTPDQINMAYEITIKRDDKYRFVIDASAF